MTSEPVRVAEPIALAAVDDHEIVLRGILSVVEECGEAIEAVAIAPTVDALLSREHGRIDVVLLDLHLNDDSDIGESVARLSAAGMRVVLFTSDVRPVPIRIGIRSGAVGLALKSDPVDRLIETITTVAGGDFAVSSEFAHVLATAPDIAGALAPREIEVLRLLAQGIPQKSVARRMTPELKTSTIREYLTRIARKYARIGRPVSSAYGAVQEAVRDGHLDIDDFGPQAPGSADD